MARVRFVSLGHWKTHEGSFEGKTLQAECPVLVSAYFSQYLLLWTVKNCVALSESLVKVEELEEGRNVPGSHVSNCRTLAVG